MMKDYSLRGTYKSILQIAGYYWHIDRTAFQLYFRRELVPVIDGGRSE